MKRKGFTLVELLVVIGIIGLLAGMLLPNLTAAWESAKRTNCKSNLKSIGTSLKAYAGNNRGNRFPSLFSSTSDARFASEAWGGGWTEDTWVLDDKGDPENDDDIALEDMEPFTCNTHCLFLLVRLGYSDTGVFTCPSDDNAELDDVARPESWWSFHMMNSCSYSYQNQLGKNTTDSLDSRTALIADHNPSRADTADDVPPGADDTDDWWNWNSPNHDWQGQNVLYGDAHVDWTTSPTCGSAGNNIWIKESWDATAKEWVEEETGKEAYAIMVEHKKDSWLVP